MADAIELYKFFDPSQSFNIVKVGKDLKRTVVEKHVSGSFVSLMEAARNHGGDVLKPKKMEKGHWVVLDDQGNRFFAE